ncbi:MAG: TIGR03792 family protein [Coleofasciculus chthonoplastes F3-SA18-01]
MSTYLSVTSTWYDSIVCTVTDQASYMVIEYLKIRVSPELRETFIQKDAEIWTSMLARCPGFISKEVWIEPETPTEVILIIRWTSREQWKAVPQEQLEGTQLHAVRPRVWQSVSDDSGE